MNDIRISNDLRLTRIGASGCVLRSDMQELEGSEGIGIERDELMPFIKALYNVACLSLDPAVRVNQLAQLLAEAKRALPNASTKDIGQSYTWQPGGWVDQYAAANDGRTVTP